MLTMFKRELNALGIIDISVKETETNWALYFIYKNKRFYIRYDVTTATAFLDVIEDDNSFYSYYVSIATLGVLLDTFVERRYI